MLLNRRGWDSTYVPVCRNASYYDEVIYWPAPKRNRPRNNFLELMERVCYRTSMSTVAEITQAIDQLDARSQFQLLEQLPSLLNIKVEDFGWLRAAESAFDFWDNPEDAIYDHLAH